ncbi:hypothetical protein L249_7408 [Ophiocordyceps polyrhachis-furcata BCC 54312]|uniref:Uncharacterized protein n=1 Tax=Ophiocordyceps polyrhachis-furcata BCC 54312 TaxID=1330021 RepID=A0A367LB38_9HYPO|nr:hypothetical protein L249_7408 [Ophiocordyceps polyrhachis-furcata BCC 54312]
MCMIWVSGPSSSCSLIRANASSDLFLMGIVIAARELGKSDFLSVGHDFSIRQNVGKKWVFCGAVKEEEGGEKLVEMEIIMSNQGVDHVIEKKKTNHVIVVLYYKVLYYSTITWLYVTPFRSLEEDFNIMDQPDDLTLYSAPIDVQRADRCDDRCNESIGRYDRYSPTVTQGVVAGLRPNCLLTRTKDNSLSYKDFYGYIKDLVYC